MAGIHGKNATLRVSTTETIVSGTTLPSGTGGTMTGTNGSYFQASSSFRNWKYDRDRTLIQFANTTVQGLPANIDTSINVQTRLINYAGGAIHLGQYPAVHSGVFAMAVSMTLTAIGNLVGDARNFNMSVASDTLESTTIGETWKTFEEGLSGFEGTLDGLWINSFWYKRAVSTLSGLLPRTVLRVGIDPKDATSYYQGTVIFPTFEISGGFDSIVEFSVPFQGRGPLDLIEGGVPFFKIHETT